MNIWKCNYCQSEFGSLNNGEIPSDFAVCPICESNNTQLLKQAKNDIQKD